MDVRGLGRSLANESSEWTCKEIRIMDDHNC